jgi:PAS domain S-box-containing protein
MTGGNVVAELGSLDSLAGVPLHQAVAHTGVALVACDADGRLTLLSPALQELFGLEFEPLGEEMLPEVFRLYHEDGQTAMAAAEMPIARARAGEFVRDSVVAARDRCGELVYLRCQAAPLTDNLGRPAGAVVLAHDVTAERLAAQRTEALRQRLVATINHEFRTPLAALLGHVELIHEHRECLDLDPDLRRWLEAIERAGWQLRDLVIEASELVSCEEGDLPVDRRPRRTA